MAFVVPIPIIKETENRFLGMLFISCKNENLEPKYNLLRYYSRSTILRYFNRYCCVEQCVRRC